LVDTAVDDDALPCPAAAADDDDDDTTSDDAAPANADGSETGAEPRRAGAGGLGQ